MKKILILALAFITIQVTAQEQKQLNKEGKERMHRYSDLSPEESSTLQTKKMTLALDLTEAQQEKVQQIFLENAKERKARMETHKAMKESGEFQKPSQEEKLKMKNERLDKQIAVKKQMKEILNEEQYKKWSEKTEQNHSRMEHKMKSHKNKDAKK